MPSWWRQFDHSFGTCPADSQACRSAIAMILFKHAKHSVTGAHGCGNAPSPLPSPRAPTARRLPSCHALNLKAPILSTSHLCRRHLLNPG